jgi:hypothetical protein
MSVGPTGSKSDISKLGLTTLASLPDKHSFERVLSALIDSAGKGECSKLEAEGVWVQFSGPKPAAQIVVGAKLFGHYVDVRKYKRSVPSHRLHSGDLVHTSGITFPTIQTLGALVSGDGTTT